MPRLTPDSFLLAFMSRPLSYLLALAACIPLPAQAPDYLTMVRRYADTMLEHGTDRYGPEKTPLFAGLLMRRTPPEIPQSAVYAEDGSGADPRDTVNFPPIYKGNNRAHKITYRGCDVADDAGLYQTLYRLSEITRNPRYASAADASLQWFLLRHVNETTGLPEWGEHAGVDFRTEQLDQGFPFDRKHEFDGRWPLYEKFFELQHSRGRSTLSVMENFARGLWFGAVGWEGRKLIYGRHAHLTLAQRPAEGEWAQFGMFPRHGGYYIDLWSRTIRTSPRVAFRNWMEPRFERFIQLIERQVFDHGYPVYLAKGEIRRNPGQMASMAWDLDQAAELLAEIWPRMSLRLRLLAERIDDDLIEHDDRLDPAAARLRWLARRKRDKGAAAHFGQQFLEGAFEVAKLDDLPERPIGEKVQDVSLPGRIPEQYANAISLLVDAADAVDGNPREVYLDGANRLATKAIEHFMDELSPLPKSFDRDAKLLDGAPFPTYYHSYLGCDDLMWALLRLHEANQRFGQVSN